MSEQPSEQHRAPLISREEARVFKRSPELLEREELNGIWYRRYSCPIDGSTFLIMETEDGR